MLEVRMQSAYAPPPRKSACWKCPCEAHMRYLPGNTHVGSTHLQSTHADVQKAALATFLWRSQARTRVRFFLQSRHADVRTAALTTFSKRSPSRMETSAIPHCRLEASSFHACTSQACGSANGRTDDVLEVFAIQTCAIRACGRADGRTDDVFEAFAFQNGNVCNSAFQTGSVRIPGMHIPGMRKCKRQHWRRFRCVRNSEMRNSGMRMCGRPH